MSEIVIAPKKPDLVSVGLNGYLVFYLSVLGGNFFVLFGRWCSSLLSALAAEWLFNSS